MTDTTQGAYQATKDAVGSAAEQVKSAAPSAYDAATHGTQYVADTVSEHPVVALLAAAGLAYLLGQLRRNPADEGADWQGRANSLQQQLRSLASRLPEKATSAKQQGRSAADYATQTAADAGEHVWQGASRAGDYLMQNAGNARGYVAQGVRDYPASTLIGVAAVSVGIGYLLRGRS